MKITPGKGDSSKLPAEGGGKEGGDKSKSDDERNIKNVL